MVQNSDFFLLFYLLLFQFNLCRSWLKDQVFCSLVWYPHLSVFWVFKHVNDNLAGDRRLEPQADRRAPDTAKDNRDNIHNDCWVSLAQF